MQQYYEKNKLEIGLDEAGRGLLLGPVFTAGVILNDIGVLPPPYPIKDSKKCSAKVRRELRKYIEQNSIAYCVEMIDIERIDKVNILNATEGMEKCVDNITSVINVDRLLVDETASLLIWINLSLNLYLMYVFQVLRRKYLNIAAASILAKVVTSIPEYILKF